jgi:hypothetical protein
MSIESQGKLEFREERLRATGYKLSAKCGGPMSAWLGLVVSCDMLLKKKLGWKKKDLQRRKCLLIRDLTRNYLAISALIGNVAADNCSASKRFNLNSECRMPTLNWRVFVSLHIICAELGMCTFGLQRFLHTAAYPHHLVQPHSSC